MRAPLLLLVAASLVSLAACPGPPDPTAADAAAYLGLGEGVTHGYQVGQGITETHEVSASSIIPAEGSLVFDVVAKQNGFVTDATQDRTLAIEVDVDVARVRRLYDCVVRCGELSAPVALFAIPFDEGEQQQTAVDVSVSENNGAPVVVSETHTVLVGGETDVTVPAGEFTGTTVSWTRARDGATDTAILVVVPEVGVVRWDGFDGSRLELLP